jgi:O-acetyl-ADP-ribose deacetylase (regulator of RNase III)
MGAGFEILVARIETLALDAVVNAANRQLLPGTGVDGALRAAAGPELTRLTTTMAAIGDGDAVLTPGFAAPARHIIHTAAPVWVLPGDESEKIAGLGRCYANCIALAAEHRLASIAFPCLGTGNFGWPRDLACSIAIDHAHAARLRAPGVTRIVFCCFTEADAAPYRARLG